MHTCKLFCESCNSNSNNNNNSNSNNSNSNSNGNSNSKTSKVCDNDLRNKNFDRSCHDKNKTLLVAQTANFTLITYYKLSTYYYGYKNTTFCSHTSFKTHGYCNARNRETFFFFRLNYCLLNFDTALPTGIIGCQIS